MTLDILLPFYGDPGLMRATVRSVLEQTDPDWRLIVVDDGYPDDSIPGWFAGLGDERVRYQRNETNLGANGNYVKCVGLAEHEAIVVLGADDLMHPNYVAVVKAARSAHPRAAVVQPGVVVIDENGTPTLPLADRVKRWYSPRSTERTVLEGEEAARSLLRGNWLYFPSLCFDLEKVRAVGFRPGLNVVQDLALVLDLVMRGEQVVVDPTVCFSYRRHGASDSSWRALEGTRFIEERDFFAGLAQEMAALGWPRAARAARLHLSSRLNALTVLPAAVRRRHRVGVRNLSRHVLGRTQGPRAQR